MSEVLEKCLSKAQAQWTQTDKIRAARCLRAQGWLRYRERQGAARVKHFETPGMGV